ncbi:PIN-like domain-containing protein [Burkholderia sp. MR1-5-21]
MKYFFDNNLSLHLAHAVGELCKVEDSVDAVIHLRDKFAANAKDHDWISALASEGHWVVLSQDGLRKNDLERKALRESGLIVFVLHRQWSERRHWDKAQNLIKWWPSVMEQSRRIKGGAAFRIPWRYGGGQFEQIKL